MVGGGGGGWSSFFNSSLHLVRYEKEMTMKRDSFVTEHSHTWCNKLRASLQKLVCPTSSSTVQ